MSRIRDNRRTRTAGFTLVELLLVIAILAMLATVVVVNISGRRVETMIGATRASIAGIAQGINLYEVDTGKYPGTLQALVQNDGSPNWRGPYVKGSLNDPWDTPFSYAQKGDNAFEIRSAGPDRQMGSGDDLTN